MPCYLFTWHTYGSWLPDRTKGYVHWSRGWAPTSTALAQRYRQQQKEPTATLTDELQRDVITELVEAAPLIGFRLHFVATDATHVHVLVSWPDDRSWKRLRRSIRRSLSVRLNRIRRRKWFSRGGPPRHVYSQTHFDHLETDYLPAHRGWKWCERRGLFK